MIKLNINNIINLLTASIYNTIKHRKLNIQYLFIINRFHETIITFSCVIIEWNNKLEMKYSIHNTILSLT